VLQIKLLMCHIEKWNGRRSASLVGVMLPRRE
jgi:hypothetical protein